MRLKSISSSLLSYYLFLDNVPFFLFLFFSIIFGRCETTPSLLRKVTVIYLFSYFIRHLRPRLQEPSPPPFFLCVYAPLLFQSFTSWSGCLSWRHSLIFPSVKKKRNFQPVSHDRNYFSSLQLSKEKRKTEFERQCRPRFFCFFLLFHCGDGTREGCCVQGSTANRFSPTSLDRNGSRSSIVTQSAAWAPPSIHSFFFFFFFSMSFAPITKKPTLENLSDYTTRSASFGRPNDLIPSAILDIIY